jgi:hypothetical protein
MGKGRQVVPINSGVDTDMMDTLRFGVFAYLLIL